MGPGLNRHDLQIRAQAKIDDATILFANGRHGNAYYLAGYAVELGLKACIATRITAQTLPWKGFIRNILSHEFKVLIGLAGLALALKDQEDRNSAFATNWNVVLQWTPDSRYESSDLASAELLIQAIIDPNAGVLTWIKAYW